MSKAYCCDNCMELYSGSPAMTDNNGNELCPNCVRIMEIFSHIDPFAGKFETKMDGDKNNE